VVYLFFYEGTSDQMRHRALMHAAQVRRDRFRDLSLLRGPGWYEPYERELFAEAFALGVGPPCEQARVRVAAALLRDHLRAVCLSGQDLKNPGRGTHYVPELRTLIERDLERLQARWGVEVGIECVLVDYIGAAVERHAAAKGYDDARKRNLIDKFPFHAAQAVGVPFACPVWVFHQFSGAAQETPPGRVPKGNETKDSKSLKENLDFLILAGKPTEQQLIVMRLDKARRGPPMPVATCWTARPGGSWTRTRRGGWSGARRRRARPAGANTTRDRRRRRRGRRW
jgi:hypothetical protein